MTSIRLKALLAKGEFILAPGVFEMFSPGSPTASGSRRCT